jgi:hypothetical protein
VGAVSFKSPLDGFSSLHEWYENEKRLFYQHVRPWIAIGAEMAKATGWRMTYKQYHWLIEFLDGMNSYERKVILPVLDDLAVCELTEYCRSQCGRDLGELDLASHYGDAVERELAPLLVKRLREAVQCVEGYRLDLDSMHKALAGISKRANEQYERAQTKWRENHELKGQLEEARKQSAAWEIQCQDLRDRLVQVERERDQLQAGLDRIEAGLDTALAERGVR